MGGFGEMKEKGEDAILYKSKIYMKINVSFKILIIALKNNKIRFSALFFDNSKRALPTKFS